MDVTGAVGRLIKLYFWVLVAAVLAVVAWLADRFLVDSGTTIVGWLSVAGFLVLVVVLLSVFRREVR